MRIVIISFFILFLTANSYCQDSLLVGRKYFEDQLYAGITYNTLTFKPDNLQQKGISTGIQFGFIKDIPLNEKGSFAIGLGLGYSFNRYNQNLKISEKEPIYSITEDVYLKNKLVTHSIEIPFEIRFRLTSTPTIYQFWRIYLGGKVGYTFISNSDFSDENEEIKISSVPNFNKFSYGPQIAIGYNTVNLYAYYNINPLFNKSEKTDGIGISDLKKINIGLQFYMF